MQELSFSETWFFKFVFPVLWIVGFGIVAIFVAPISFSADPLTRWTFVAAWLAGIGLIGWCCIRAKKVWLDRDSFVISNFRSEIRVPIRDVERVTGSMLLTPDVIWLHFRRPTEFGRSILFLAPPRVFGISRHPLVSELQALIARASYQAQNRF